MSGCGRVDDSPPASDCRGCPAGIAATPGALRSALLCFALPLAVVGLVAALAEALAPAHPTLALGGWLVLPLLVVISRLRYRRSHRVERS